MAFAVHQEVPQIFFFLNFCVSFASISALACTQPQATGPNPTEPRWWYNSVTGTCQQFLWDPTAINQYEHSSNNFRTVEHCESYCRDSKG